MLNVLFNLVNNLLFNVNILLNFVNYLYLININLKYNVILINKNIIKKNKKMRYNLIKKSIKN